MKNLVVVVFFSCIAVRDPLNYFGSNTQSNVEISYNNFAVTIQDLHSHNSQICVVLITNNEGTPALIQQKEIYK